MSSFTDQGLLLRRFHYGESDSGFLFLSREHGLVRALAKGARRSKRRFAGVLDLFHHVKFTVERRREHAPLNLTEATLLNAFLPLRESYERLWMASCFADIAARTMEEESPFHSKGAYLCLGASLTWLCSAPASSVLWVGSAFLIQWAVLQGWWPTEEVARRLFEVSDEHWLLWRRVTSEPLVDLVRDEAWVQFLAPSSAGYWFDQLVRWIGREHHVFLLPQQELA